MSFVVPQHSSTCPWHASTRQSMCSAAHLGITELQNTHNPESGDKLEACGMWVLSEPASWWMASEACTTLARESDSRRENAARRGHRWLRATVGRQGVVCRA